MRFKKRGITYRYVVSTLTSVYIFVDLAVHLGSKGLEVERGRDPVVDAPALTPKKKKGFVFSFNGKRDKVKVKSKYNALSNNTNFQR